MKQGAIIILAWPEGMVRAAGSWYDKLLAKNGKYRVGHSAIVIIDYSIKKSYYFDFGRYHTPKGYGRVRDVQTDPDLSVIAPEIKNGKIINLECILLHLSNMKSTHGEGKMYASIRERVNVQKAFFAAKTLQKKGMIRYGPFIINGTNCSRFVAHVAKASTTSIRTKLRLTFPFCITPSPKRNVSIINNNYFIVDDFNCKQVLKSKIVSYFSSIESI
ncbi:MAG: hypothetical protein CMD15_05570 [Flavobacteriales bacterium]|nr:hypothetical protein [Flavobacteriales bacterium]|tara:strand:+ start:434218 stop:434868 length:651 start_codon:yes stop_codon:yes gene_type:complete